jgi:hypothetical protein
MIRYYRRFLEERELRQRWVDPRLASVRVAHVLAYLLAKGWKEVPSDRDGSRVFEEPVAGANGPFYQFVPLDENWPGFQALIWELVAHLAHIEDRYAGDVLTDILNAGADTTANGAAGEQPPQVAER